MEKEPVSLASEGIMRQVAKFALVAVLSLSVLPLAAAQGEAAQAALGGAVPSAAPAVISGSVVNLGGEALTNTVVQARSLLTGAIGGSTSTTAAGQFVLSVNPGSYVLEVVDAGGQIVGTSSFILATAGAAISAATVTATTGALGVVGGATGLLAAVTGTSGIGNAAATGTAAALSTAATIGQTVTTVAAGAGVPGVIAPPDVPIASPSR